MNTLRCTSTVMEEVPTYQEKMMLKLIIEKDQITIPNETKSSLRDE